MIFFCSPLSNTWKSSGFRLLTVWPFLSRTTTSNRTSSLVVRTAAPCRGALGFCWARPAGAKLSAAAARQKHAILARFLLVDSFFTDILAHLPVPVDAG